MTDLTNTKRITDLPAKGFIRIDGIIGTPDYQGLIPVSRPTIYRWMAQGSFPKQVKISGVAAWKISDINNWLEAQA